MVGFLNETLKPQLLSCNMDGHCSCKLYMCFAKSKRIPLNQKISGKGTNIMQPFLPQIQPSDNISLKPGLFLDYSSRICLAFHKLYLSMFYLITVLIRGHSTSSDIKHDVIPMPLEESKMKNVTVNLQCCPPRCLLMNPSPGEFPTNMWSVLLLFCESMSVLVCGCCPGEYSATSCLLLSIGTWIWGASVCTASL